MNASLILESLAWTIALVAAWLVLVIYVISWINRLWMVENAFKELGSSKFKIVITFIVFIALGYLTSTTYLYRTQQRIPSNTNVRDHYLHELDSAPAPEIPEASRSLTDREDWEDAKKRNLRENRGTVEQFDELPDHDEASSETDDGS